MTTDAYLLLSEIEVLRARMSDMANRKGITSPEAVQLSQELDTLLNVYRDVTISK